MSEATLNGNLNACTCSSCVAVHVVSTMFTTIKFILFHKVKLHCFAEKGC